MRRQQTLLDPAQRAADAAVAIDWYEPSPDGSLVAVGAQRGRYRGEHPDCHRGRALAWLVPSRSPTRGLRRSPGCPTAQASGTCAIPKVTDTTAMSTSIDWAPSPAADPLVFDDLPTPETWPDVLASDDGRYLLVSMLVGWGRIDAQLLDTESGEWREVDQWRRGAVVVLLPRRRVVRGHVAAMRRTAASWRPRWTPPTFGARSLPSATSSSPEPPVSAIGCWSCRARQPSTRSNCGATDGTFDGNVEGLGLISVQSLDTEDAIAFLTVASFDAPPTLYRLTGPDAERWSSEPDSSVIPRLTVRQLTYPSLDGTEIGLFVVHRADIEPSPQTPAAAHRLRRVRNRRDTLVGRSCCRVVRRRWSVRGCRAARRVRARRGLASCRSSSQQAERLRRLPCRSRLAGRPRFHVAATCSRSKVDRTVDS